MGTLQEGTVLLISLVHIGQIISTSNGKDRLSISPFGRRSLKGMGKSPLWNLIRHLIG